MNNLDKLVEQLAEEASPVKPAPKPWRLSLLWAIAAVLYVALSVWISGPRSELLQKLQEPWLAVELLVLLLLFVSASLSAAVLAFPDLHQMRAAAWSPLVMFALLIITLTLAWHADSPAAPLPVHNVECTVSITLFSLLPATWTFLSMRRYATVHQRWAGSVALLAAFSVGALWLRLHEENDSINHVILWHYLPMLVIGIIGWSMGKRLLKW